MGVLSMTTIRELMEQQDMTLMQLATKARVSISTLQRIMDGKVSPWRKTKEDIAAALGNTIDEIAWPETKRERP